MPCRLFRPLLAAMLAAGAANPVAALTTTPASAPHTTLVAAAHLPRPAGIVDPPVSFAAGAGAAPAAGLRAYPTLPPAATAAAAVPPAWSWHGALPEAGTAEALFIGLLAVAGALLRMAHAQR